MQSETLASQGRAGGLEQHPSWHPLRISVRNLIRDFLDMYSSSPEEVMVIESIANSLDAGATRIVVDLKKRAGGRGLFTIADDGVGMSEETFQDSYHALALSSKAKGQTIGFAGIGGKLYLAMLEAGRSIYTETRSETFWGASELGMNGDEAIWRPVEPRGNVTTKTGTYIEVETRGSTLDERAVENAIKEHYGAVLAGMRGNTMIFVGKGSRNLLPWIPSKTLDTELFTFNVKGKKCTACFWLSRDDFDSPKGVDIAVLGKKVKAEQWFNLQFDIKPEFSKRVYGLVNADVLATLLTANKQDLRGGNDRVWQEFRRKSYRVFKRWLTRIGAIQRSNRSAAFRPGEEAMTREVTRAIAEVLRRPGLSGYSVGMAPIREDGRRQESVGAEEEPVDPSTNPRGSLPLQSVPNRTREGGRDSGAPPAPGRAGSANPGFALSMAYRPSTVEEAWVEPGGIVINSAHPVFKKSRELGTSVEADHIIRSAFMALVESSDPSKSQVLGELRSLYRAWAEISPGH